MAMNTPHTIMESPPANTLALLMTNVHGLMGFMPNTKQARKPKQVNLWIIMLYYTRLAFQQLISDVMSQSKVSGIMVETGTL